MDRISAQPENILYFTTQGGLKSFKIVAVRRSVSVRSQLQEVALSVSHLAERLNDLFGLLRTNPKAVLPTSPSQALAIETDDPSKLMEQIRVLKTSFQAQASPIYFVVEKGKLKGLKAAEVIQDKRVLGQEHDLGGYIIAFVQAAIFALLFYGVWAGVSSTSGGDNNRLGKAFSGDVMSKSNLVLEFDQFFFLALILFCGIPKWLLTQKTLGYQILSDPATRFNICTTPLTKETLIGTLKAPGFLPRSEGGVLFVAHIGLVDEASLQIMNSVLSGGTYSLRSETGSDKVELHFTGRIIFGFKPGEFEQLPDVSRRSGRFRKVSLIPHGPNEVPRPFFAPRSDRSDLDARRQILTHPGWNPFSYDNIPDRFALSFLEDHPFILTVGRNDQIALIQAAVDKYVTAIVQGNKPLPFTLYIVDQQASSSATDRLRATYGVGKTQLAIAAVHYANRLLVKAGHTLPGLVYLRDGDTASPQKLSPAQPAERGFLRRMAGYVPGVDTILDDDNPFFGIHRRLRGAEILLGISQQTLMWTTLGSVLNERGGEGAFLMGAIETAMAAANLGINGGVIFLSWFLDRMSSNSLRNVVVLPSAHFSLRELHTADYTLPDWSGRYVVDSPSSPPQFRFKPSENGDNILGGNPYSQALMFESEATEGLENHPQVAAMLEQVIKTGTLGSRAEINDMTTMFIFTANKADQTRRISAMCEHHIELPTTIEDEGDTSNKLILIQLKRHNEAIGGLPWSTEAMSEFLCNIRTPDGRIFMIRLYFQDLLGSATRYAKKRGAGEVSLEDYKLAFLELRYHFGDYINPHLGLPPLTKREIEGLTAAARLEDSVVVNMESVA